MSLDLAACVSSRPAAGRASRPRVIETAAERHKSLYRNEKALRRAGELALVVHFDTAH